MQCSPTICEGAIRRVKLGFQRHQLSRQVIGTLIDPANRENILVVNWIKCKEDGKDPCGSSYMGETARSLKVRAPPP